MLKQLLLGLALLAAAPVLAQTIDPTFTSPASVYANGGVYALGPQQADGKRVLAGVFTRLGGQATGNVARVDNAGVLDQAFAQNVGTASNVYRVVAGLGGQYLLGAWGGDIVAGGVTRTEVLRLNADGTADAGFNAGAGPSLGTATGYGQDYAVQADGKVLVGGNFTAWSGTAAPGLVRLTSTGALDQTFITNLGSGINCAGGDEVRTVLVLPDGKLLVGGVFASFGGHAATGLVRLNADGSYDATFTCGLPADSFVTSVVRQPDGNLLLDAYAPGSSSGNSGSSLARLLPSGARDATFTCEEYLSNYRNAIDPRLALQPDGKIVVVGGSSGYFTRLTSTGAPDPAFQPSSRPNRTPSTVGVQPDGGILTAVVSSDNLFGSLDATVARYGSTGTLQPGFFPKPQTTAVVTRVLRLADGSVLAGGTFSEWNGQPVHHLVHLGSDGTYDAAFTANTPVAVGYVNALAQQPDGKLLVVAGGLTRLLLSGAPDPGFNQTIVSSAFSVALQPDGRIVVGSASPQVSYASVPNQHLIRLTSAGAVDNSFVATTPIGSFAGTYVSALALQPDGKVLVAQLLNSYVGLFRLTAAGSLDNTFTPVTFGGGYLVTTLALQADGSILAGGNFLTVNGTAQRGVARLTSTGSLDAGFTAGPTLTAGTVSALALQPNNRVLLGGTFSTSSANGSFSRLGRVLANGQPDLSFAGGSAAPNGAVTGLQVLPDGKLLVSGSFTSIGGQPALNIARLTASNVLAVAAPGTVAAATAAWPVPAHEVLHVQPAASAHPLEAELLDALGRVVRQQALAGPAGFSFDTSALPAGLYVLRLRYAEGTVARQLAVE